MAERRNIPFKEFALIINSLYREFTSEQGGTISNMDQSMFYTRPGESHHALSIYCAQMSHSTELWVNIGAKEFSYAMPSWYKFEEKRLLVPVIEKYNEMRGKSGSTLERLICAVIPSAKDVIAEAALVEDDKDGN